MCTKRREQPSVVSTRILKTHRMNAVKAFELQRRIQTIENEIRQNHSQISDEIDGIRKSLVKIKNIKHGMSLSVERRMLLKELGYRVFPVRGGQRNTVILISRDGKRTCLNVADFYSESKPNVLQWGHDKVDQRDERSTTKVKENQIRKNKSKDFCFRVVRPPHRVGSIRNFNNTEFENDTSDEEPTMLVDPGKVVEPDTLKLEQPRSRTRTTFSALATDSMSNNESFKSSGKQERIKTCPSNIATINLYKDFYEKKGFVDSSSPMKKTDCQETETLEKDCLYDQKLRNLCSKAYSCENGKMKKVLRQNTFVSSPLHKMPSRKLSLDSEQQNKSDIMLKPSTKELRNLSFNSSVAANDYSQSRKDSSWIHEDSANKSLNSMASKSVSFTVDSKKAELNSVSEFEKPLDKEGGLSDEEERIDAAPLSLQHWNPENVTTQEHENSMSNSTSTKTRCVTRSANTKRLKEKTGIDISIRDTNLNDLINKDLTTMQITLRGRLVKVNLSKFSGGSFNTVSRARSQTWSGGNSLRAPLVNNSMYK